MTNLLDETIEVLEQNDKKPTDVEWVGNSEIRFTWQHFTTIANFNYSDGFGGQHIAKDLVIVGKDFWLERHEFDGSEWWEFKQLPVMPEKKLDVKRVGGNEYLWATLEEIQKEGGQFDVEEETQ